MKLYRVLLIAVLASTLSVLGCGDEGGGSNPPGNGNGNGASGVCAACDLPALSGECERAYNVCIEEDAGGSEECKVVGLSECGA